MVFFFTFRDIDSQFKYIFVSFKLTSTLLEKRLVFLLSLTQNHTYVYMYFEQIMTFSSYLCYA